MVKYNDDQLGAGEEEDGGPWGRQDQQGSTHDQILLQTAVDDYVKNFQAEPVQ